MSSFTKSTSKMRGSIGRKRGALLMRLRKWEVFGFSIICGAAIILQFKMWRTFKYFLIQV